MSVELNAEIVAPTGNPVDIPLSENVDETSERKNKSVSYGTTEEVIAEQVVRENDDIPDLNQEGERKSTPDEEKKKNEQSEAPPVRETSAALATETVALTKEPERVTENAKSEGIETERTQEAVTFQEGEEKDTLKTTDETVSKEPAENRENTDVEGEKEMEDQGDGKERKDPSLPIRENIALDDFATMMRKADSTEIQVEQIYPQDEQTERSEKVDKKRISADISVTIRPRLSLESDEEPDEVSHFSFAASTYTESEESESLTSSAKPTLKEEDQVDRSLYYELHELYTNEHRNLKRRNNYLQSRLADYYSRRRMFHVLITDKSTLDENKKKYEKTLDELDAQHERDIREQSSLENEIEDLRSKHRFKKDKLESLFETLQKLEFDFSKELINAKEEEGKLHAEKFVERYLKRQKNVISSLSHMRRIYIKLQNKYNETQDMLNSLDNLGSNLHLIDYEQLKTDNRNLQDKLEEREQQLTTLRNQCQNAMQILAHTREEVAGMDKVIAQYRETLDEVTGDFADAREQVSMYKAERDRLRVLINKRKEEIGLLARPKLLRDMEKSIREVEEMKLKIEKYKTDFKSVSSALAKVNTSYEAVTKNLSHRVLTDTKRAIPNKLSSSSIAW